MNSHSCPIPQSADLILGQMDRPTELEGPLELLIVAKKGKKMQPKMLKKESKCHAFISELRHIPQTVKICVITILYLVRESGIDSSLHGINTTLSFICYSMLPVILWAVSCAFYCVTCNMTEFLPTSLKQCFSILTKDKRLHHISHCLSVFHYSGYVTQWSIYMSFPQCK